MTLSISPTAQGFFLVGGTAISGATNDFDDSIPECCLYQFQLSPNIYFISNLTMKFTISALTGAGVIYVVVLTDPATYSGFPLGGLAHDQIPAVVAPLLPATGPSIELARATVANGAVSLDLDMTTLLRFMTSTNSAGAGWTGSLVLWLVGAGTAGTVSNLTLSTVGIQDYPNRDTGRSGAPKGSRVSRCPITGIAISRQNMVRDGYRQIYVHPMAYDPPQPEQPLWGEYPDPNEDG